MTSSFTQETKYELPQTQTVSKVTIYGVESEPVLVLGGNVEVDFMYDASQKAVIATDFELTLG